MKMIIKIAIVLAAVLCIYFAKKTISSHTFDGSDMVNDASISSVEYYLSPDEYGHSADILLKDELIKYHYYDDETEGKLVEGSCSVGNDLYDSLENIVREYDIRSWANLPSSDFEVLDASTTTLKIEFTDGTIVCLGDDYQMPDGAWKAVSEICDLLEASFR